MNLLSFDSIQCARTRGHLDAYLSNELLVETTSEVLKHLETCAGCSRELEARSRVREALRRAAAAQAVPKGLDQTIHKRLQESQPGWAWGFPPSRWAVALAGVALVAIAVVATQQWRSLQRGRQLVASVLGLGVSDHLHCAIRGHNYPEVAHSPEELRAKLGPLYAGLLPVVEQRLPGFQVLEAHLCSVPGSSRQFVHMIARQDKTILSVVLTRRDGESFPPGNFLAASAQSSVTLYQTHLQGMNVAGFSSKEYFGFVVSDLGQQDVLEIASAIAPPLQKALDGNGGAARIDSPPIFPNQLGRGGAGRSSKGDS